MITGFALSAYLRGLETQTGLVILVALLPVYAFTAFYNHAYAADHLQSPLLAAAKGASEKALNAAKAKATLNNYNSNNH